MSVKNIKVTVVTVTFNASESIESTIQSVLMQAYDNIEYIIIDGNSTDGTLNIIEKYRDRIDKVLVEVDSGIYDAMNKALSMASGDFIIFLNSGDRFFENFTISSIVANITDLNTIYYGNAIFVDRDKCIARFYGGKFNKCRLCLCNICHQTIFYPKAVYQRYRYELKYKIFADYCYNISLFSTYTYQHVNTIVCFYDTSGISSRCTDSFYADKYKLIRRYLGIFYSVYFFIVVKCRGLKKRFFCENYVA